MYMRLSRDDEKTTESVSIENQRIILRKYATERGGTVIDEYVDDGYSGTSFDRPEIKRLLLDAQSGKIDTIIVKDLSRFGRNYIQVGQYIDYIFPAYGIRFIAINDNVDTADRNSTAMDMMPIMNVFNEWHAANTSKKIRAVLEAKQRAGKYTSWNYSYGYKVGKDDNRTAVIDEPAAEVVRRIFELRAEGNSTRTIARILTDDGVQNPTSYFTRLNGEKWNRPCKPYWWPSTVADILSNPVYIGVTVQHKTTGVSYKNRKKINIPASERIIKENAHQPIISRELWDKVQDMNRTVSRGKADKSGNIHALSGLLVCADCGGKLKLKTAGKTYKDSNAVRCGYYCRTYIDLGKKYCSSHSITEREIESVVLNDIKAMKGSVVIDEQKAIERFEKERAVGESKSGCSVEKQLKEHTARLADIDKLLQAAFEDRVLNGMDESLYSSLCDKYQKERAATEEKITELISRLENAHNNRDACEYIYKLKAYCDCESLTREMCLQLVNFITVGKRNETDGGREIHIYYNLSSDLR